MANNAPSISAVGIASIARPSNAGIIFGDSIAANAWYSATVTGCTRTSNVVTVPQASHGRATGQWTFISNATDTSYNGVFAQITVIDSNNFSYPQVAANASSTTLTSANAGVLNDNGWYTWASMLGKNTFSILLNAGIGGNLVTDMYARIGPDCLNRNPAWVSYMGGINDVAAGTSAATIFNGVSGIKAQCDMILARGMTLFLWTILPLETGHASFTAAKTLVRMEVNRLIRQYAKTNGNIILCDGAAAFEDPTTTTCPARTGYLVSDHIHPSTKGCKVLGAIFAAAAAGRISQASTLINSAGDNRTINAGSTNIWPSLPSTTTGGSIAGTNVTGTPPAGFKVNSQVGTPTVVASGPARTVSHDGDDYGNNCKAVITPSAANDQVWITQSASGWSNSGNCAIGKAYQFEFTVQATNVAGSNLLSLYAQAIFVIDGVNYTHNFMNPTSASGTINTEDFTGVFRTVPYFLAGTACTQAVIRVIAIYSASGTAMTLEVGRFACNEIAATQSLTF